MFQTLVVLLLPWSLLSIAGGLMIGPFMAAPPSREAIG
jgi:hypothetical protein